MPIRIVFCHDRFPLVVPLVVAARYEPLGVWADAGCCAWITVVVCITGVAAAAGASCCKLMMEKS